jgi:hypothetical protein
LVNGYTLPARGIDYDDRIVTKLLAWVELASGRSPAVKYEMSRPAATELLHRLAGRH